MENVGAALQTARQASVGGGGAGGHTCGGRIPGVFPLPYLLYSCFHHSHRHIVLFFVVLSTPAALLLGVNRGPVRKSSLW